MRVHKGLQERSLLSLSLWSRANTNTILIATSIGFLQKYGLQDDFKLNIEVNHATLAQHTFEHELTVAANDNMLGSIDANRGDYQNGWDTDQFPNNIEETDRAMMVFLKEGGLQGGGVNFSVKINTSTF